MQDATGKAGAGGGGEAREVPGGTHVTLRVSAPYMLHPGTPACLPYSQPWQSERSAVEGNTPSEGRGLGEDSLVVIT